VDPGSSAALVEDPRGALGRLQESAGLPLDHLAAAAQHTAREVEVKAEALATDEPSADISIVLFGSWARYGVAPSSARNSTLSVCRQSGARVIPLLHGAEQEALRGAQRVSEARPARAVAIGKTCRFW
jgi:hypothetical protein